MSGKTFIEKSREIAVVGGYDVVVCGGGTAGFPAAIAAAREGQRVALIERYGFLGGVPAYCIMPAWHRLHEFNVGLLSEFMTKVSQMNMGPDPLDCQHTEPECIKALSMDMVIEAGVEVHLHTLVTDVIIEDNALVGVITESKSGRRAFMGKAFVDATGDGDVAALAGVPFAKGNDEGVTQGMTLRIRVGGIDFERYLDWAQANPQYYGAMASKLPHIRQLAAQGKPFFLGCDIAPLLQQAPNADELPTKSYFNGSSIRRNELSLNCTRVYGLDGTREEDLTSAEISCRNQAIALYKFLRDTIPGFENAMLIETAPQIGVRESRRILGEYMLTQEDCRAGRRFDDEIALNPISFDLHDANYSCESLHNRVGIPFRCLVPQKIDNLLIAGRCISTDHIANSSVRRMHTCFHVGQVAGVAAAMAARRGVAVRKMEFADLRGRLTALGCIEK